MPSHLNAVYMYIKFMNQDTMFLLSWLSGIGRSLPARGGGTDCSSGGAQWLWQEHHHSTVAEVLRPTRWRGRDGGEGRGGEAR